MIKKHTVFVVGWAVEEEEPMFGKVMDIYTTTNMVLFLVQQLKTVRFDRQYHAYIVTATQELALVEHSKLVSSTPLHLKPFSFPLKAIVPHFHILSVFDC